MAAYDAADIANQTTAGDSAEIKKWETDFRKEYIRKNAFFPYMGSSKKTSIIHNHKKLTEAGLEIKVPLVNQLRGNRKGLATLVGNENQFHIDTYFARPIYVREAVTLRIDQKRKSFVDLLNARRQVLSDKAKDLLTEFIMEALRSVGTTGVVDLDTATSQNIHYENATGPQLDTWNTNNPYRVFYGAANANRTAGNHAASIGALGVADVPSSDLLDHLRSEAMARNFAAGATSRTALRPVEISGMAEKFVCFCGTKAFNAFRKDPVIRENYRDAALTGMKNRLFTGGDTIMYENVIIKRVPELDLFEPSATVGRISFCGAHAFARAVGDNLKSTKRNETDYQTIDGVGFMEMYSVEKVFLADKNIDPLNPLPAQFGVIDCFVTLP